MSKITKLLISFSLFLSFPLFYSEAKAAASLEFERPGINLAVGEEAVVGVIVNPAGQEVMGVDLFFKFDPEYIRIKDVKSSGVFSFQPAKKIDNSKGDVKTAFSNNLGVYQKTRTKFAEITIEALKESDKTTLSFDFTPGSTTDSNVVVRGGRDILARVNNLTLSVGGKNNPGSSTQASDQNVRAGPGGLAGRFNESEDSGTGASEGELGEVEGEKTDPEKELPVLGKAVGDGDRETLSASGGKGMVYFLAIFASALFLSSGSYYLAKRWEG